MKKKLFVKSGILALLVWINNMAFAANDSSALSAPSPNYQKQYLLVDSQTPTATSRSTFGQPNRTIVCNKDEQLVGIVESHAGRDDDPGYYAFARDFIQQGNFVYVPRCANPDYTTGKCTRDWVYTYNKIDTLKIICAKNSMHWEDKATEHTTTADPNAVRIGP